MSVAAASDCARLTVALMVHDDPAGLAGSLASVRKLADEVLVIDAGTADRRITPQDCPGARIVAPPWEESAAAARNAGWEAASGDWLLWLDAGERLDPQTCFYLRRFVDSVAVPETIYALMVESPPTDPAAPVEQAAQWRLTPNRPDLRFVGRVRETLAPAVAALGMQSASAPGRILRDPSIGQPQHKRAAAQRDLALAAREVAETGGISVRLLLAMGEAHAELGQDDPAAVCFRQAIAAAARGSREMREGYYGLLAALEADRARAGEQTQACLEALDVFPLDAQLLLLIGKCMQRVDRPDLAARAYEASFRHGQVEPALWHLKELPQMAAACWAQSLQQFNADDQATGVLEDAVARYGNSPYLLRPLLDLYVKHGRTHEALAAADQLPISDAQIGPLHEAVLGACKGTTGCWPEALRHLQIAFHDGCRHPLCLRWLTVACLAARQPKAARPVVAAWQSCEPGNVEAATYAAAVDELIRLQGEEARTAAAAGDASADDTPALPASTAAAGSPAPPSEALWRVDPPVAVVLPSVPSATLQQPA